jgi:hypothetical protein
MSAIRVTMKSTSSRIGESNWNGACSFRSAAAAPARIRWHATEGATLLAANRPTACFTTTVSTSGPSNSFASSASA